MASSVRRLRRAGRTRAHLDLGQQRVGDRPGRVEHGVVLLEDRRRERAGQHLHREDLLHRRREAQEGDHLPGVDVDRPHAARALRVLVGERDVGERVRLAQLRQAHERDRPGEGEAARETGHLRDRLDATAQRVDRGERALARLEHPQTPAMQPRRVRHRQPARDDLARLDVDHHAAGALVGAPALARVPRAQRGDEARLAVAHREAVQVAAVLGRVAGHEARPPARHEAVLVVERAQAGEQRVHVPALGRRERHLVDVDVAGDVDVAQQVDRVVDVRRREARRDRGHVAVLVHAAVRADEDAVEVRREAHRPRHRVEVRVEASAALRAHEDQPPGLEGRDQQRRAQLGEQRPEVRRVDAGERLGSGGRGLRGRGIGGQGGGRRTRAWRSAGGRS